MLCLTGGHLQAATWTTTGDGPLEDTDGTTTELTEQPRKVAAGGCQRGERSCMQDEHRQTIERRYTRAPVPARLRAET